MTSSNHFDVQHVGCRNAAARRCRPESQYAAECPRSKFGLSTVELTDRHDHPSGHTFSEKACRHSACIIACRAFDAESWTASRAARGVTPLESVRGSVVTSFDGGTSCRHAFSTRRYCHLGSSSHGGVFACVKGGLEFWRLCRHRARTPAAAARFLFTSRRFSQSLKLVTIANYRSRETSQSGT